jgi:hypothetical protein
MLWILLDELLVFFLYWDVQVQNLTQTEKREIAEDDFPVVTVGTDVCSVIARTELRL